MIDSTCTSIKLTHIVQCFDCSPAEHSLQEFVRRHCKPNNATMQQVHYGYGSNYNIADFSNLSGYCLNKINNQT